MPQSRRSGVTAGPLAAALALGLALSGCGSGDAEQGAAESSDPVAWAGAFCGSYQGATAGMAAITKAQPTPQGQKDGLLAFTGSIQQAFADTARKLEQLGPPRITDGKRVHDTAVGLFTAAAGTVRDQREKLAALDANAPDFVQQASQLAGPDLDAASAQMRELTSNNELTSAFRAAPACSQLGPTAGR